MESCVSPSVAIETSTGVSHDVLTNQDSLLPKIKSGVRDTPISTPESKSGEKSSSELVTQVPVVVAPYLTLDSLWGQAVLHYRRRVSLDASEEKLFCDPVELATNSHVEQYQRAIVAWRSFRSRSNSGKLKKTKDRVNRFMVILQEKIET